MDKKELPFIKSMFENIADNYDFLNKLLSLRQDVYWRKKMISSLNIKENFKIIDVACGTGDVIIEIMKNNYKNIHLYGADFSKNMISIALKKIKKKNYTLNFNFLLTNALYLPFLNESFNAVTIAFGIRNILNKDQALKEFYNILKPGGTLAVLELTTPKSGFFFTLYMIYFKKILPLIGQFFSENRQAYRYLPKSVENFPTSDIFINKIKKAGFKNVSKSKLTLGITTLFIGSK